MTALQGRDHDADRGTALVWIGFVVVALCALEVLNLTVYGVVVPAAAMVLWLVTRHRSSAVSREPVDGADLVAVGVFYVGVVALFGLAFEGFGTGRVAGLFLSFAAGLIVGVAGPIVYTVWHRRRPLRTLGLTVERLPATIALGLVFAAVQFALTLWRYDLPATQEWVPLLVMSLVVGGFEAVFFRGFIQGRLEASFGTGPAVAGGAALYALYHVAYGMAASEILFLLGLGVVYGIAYGLVGNVLVLWPLLTPLGGFFANLEAGDIELPWASIAGFVDVAAVMIAVIWVAHRHEQRQLRDCAGRPSAPARSGTRAGSA
jgi:membrane protease YdiL (CAAX protease family)